MASEQPELLFFDTFSHETSEKHYQKVDRSNGFTLSLTENIDHKNVPVGKECMNNQTYEVNFSFSLLDVPNKDTLKLSDIKKHIYLGDETENLLTVENIGEDFCEFEFKNTDITEESVEHICSLWIPSKRTKLSLDMKKMPSCDIPVKELSSFPEICEENLPERLQQEVAAVGEMGDTNVTIPYMNQVPHNEYGLVELVQKEAFRDAVHLTKQLLTAFGKSNQPRCHSKRSIQMWYIRLALLVKLREFERADEEASLWADCDKPDLYYQFYPDIYPGRSGSMVPFQMRLLLANLPSYCGRHSESLNKLFSILSTVRNILQNLKSQSDINLTDFTRAKRLWISREKHVLTSIVNVAVQMKDFILAGDILNIMVTNEMVVSDKQILYSILGRIYLQFGDLINAEKSFVMAQSDGSEIRDLYCNLQNFRSFVDRGLMAVARNDFQEGYKWFEQASIMDPSSLLVMNNCAVCLFYLGHSSEAIRLLTGALNNDPLHALQDSLVLNLCSMHDLSTANSRNKKLELLKLSRLFKGDSINLSSFRLF